MTNGLFIPSGARVALVGLPPIDRPIRLADGRALRYSSAHVEPDGVGGVIRAQHWLGPQGLQMVASLDDTPAWGPLLHISVSYAGQKRRPTWEELAAIKDAMFGDVDACMILPKSEDFVHGVPGCPNTEVYHLWQIPQRWGIR